MANLLTLTLDTGSLRVMTATSSLINPIYFPLSKSISNSYVPWMPESAIILTQSSDQTNNSTTTSASLMTFTLPSTAEKFYFLNECIVGVQAPGVTVGPKVTMQSVNNADSMFVVKHASSLTAQQFLIKGTKDTLIYPSSSTVAVANVTVPNEIRGITNNSGLFGGAFSNSLILQTATASQQVSATSGSYWSNTYVGLSSSVQPNSASLGPLAISQSLMKVVNGPNDYIDRLVTFDTASLTKFAKTTINYTSDFSADGGVWIEVFDFGLSGSFVSGRRYWMAFYLFAFTGASTTGFRVQVSGSSNIWGSTHTVASAVGRTISTSTGSGQLTQDSSTATVGGTGNIIVFGEFTSTSLTSNLGPKVLFRVEPVAGLTAQVKSGSLFLWREIS